jgi:hypothetical protein
MKININVTNRDLDDLLITAIEGKYTTMWAELQRYSPSKAKVTLRDGDNKRARWIDVTRKTIARGLTLAAKADQNDGGWAFAAWLKDRTGDGIIADAIMQFGVFGKIKYE